MWRLASSSSSSSSSRVRASRVINSNAVSNRVSNSAFNRVSLLAARSFSFCLPHQDDRTPLFAAAAAAAATLFAYQRQQQRKRQTECCGIVGVVSSGNYDARGFLLNGLTILKNRGFDSAGMATLAADGSGLTAITKFASTEQEDSIDLVRKHAATPVPAHSVGVAHTRWATHGGKTDANAHPHTAGKIAVVHNGTILNSGKLRREIQALDPAVQFHSTTDSEVLAVWINHFYTTQENCTVKQATEQALAKCEGTWGLCVLCADCPTQLVVACHGSPMNLGLDPTAGNVYVASEPAAFSGHVNSFIRMKDNEIAVLHPDRSDLVLNLERMETMSAESLPFASQPEEGYDHWSLQEIYEQPEAAGRALAFGGRLGFDRVHLGGLDAQKARLSNVRHLLLSACGTSLNAARYGERLFKVLAATESCHTLDAAETEVKDFLRPPHQSALLVVSQSGETKDVVNVVEGSMKEAGQTKAPAVVLSVVNAVGSSIAQATKLGVYCNAGREMAVASTKAFTSQVTVLALIALWFRQLRDEKLEVLSDTSSKEAPGTTELKEALMRLPLSFGGALKTREQCQKLAAELKDKEHCFVLGKGFGEPVAMEGALKIKEFSYMHAEGYSGGALKHGPFALIEGPEGKFGATPVIMLILDDQHAHHMRTAAEEVKARGARVVIITDNRDLADGLCDDPVLIPTNGPLTALGAVIPLQLLAYELALQRGINPDHPRNLAKAVLVD